ncbi:DNA polymerase III subunit delta [Candidatus Uhrbacteria bacterium]|nr:DNA polymerase III subunit delta [Candidatus Uhrbacteria bacterium]
MLILIYGEDSFRVTEKVRQLKDAFRRKYDLTGYNTVSFPSDNSNKLEVSEVLQSVCSFPFLGSRRMVIVNGLFSFLKKPYEKIWLDGFSRMPESSIVILWEAIETKVVEKKSWIKEISKTAEVHTYPFPILTGPALVKWIFDRARAFGGLIDQNASTALVERVESDLWQMSHEIEKLIGYSHGKLITKEMVDELVLASFEGKIFELMDAISKKQTSRAIRLLEEERSSGSDDHYLLTMLGRQVRVLLGTRAMLDLDPKVTKQTVAEELDVHPFVAQKSLEQARMFSFSDLRIAHDLLFEFDLKIKTGRISADLATDLVTDHLLMKF